MIYGIIGAGSFGIALANVIAERTNVLVFTRRPDVANNINTLRRNRNQNVHENIEAILDIERLCGECNLIFPVVPSSDFRNVMRLAAPYLKPYHQLIHGTKGLQVELPNQQKWDGNSAIKKDYIKTMSQIILEETNVLRVGCLSGPNLALEMAQKHPSATVIASKFDGVINAGYEALHSQRFRVYRSHDIFSVELAGVFKNIMAIAAGISAGLDFGENAKAMLITRGFREIIHLAKTLDANPNAFLGVAGIGDLIATCSSNLSRNFSVGQRLAKGETIDDIKNTMTETVEGINTTLLAHALAKQYRLQLPITTALTRLFQNECDVPTALQELLQHPNDEDVDFLATPTSSAAN